MGQISLSHFFVNLFQDEAINRNKPNMINKKADA